MNTYLVAMQYYDDTFCPGIWVDIERLVVCSNEDQIVEWAGDLGWQVFTIIKVDPKHHIGLKTVTI